MEAPIYFVRRTDGPDWSGAERVSLQHTPWLPEGPAAACFSACHDGERLYLRLEAEETPIRATLTGPLDQVCEDSCLEFFFAPDESGRYFNFEFNPLGTLYLGFGAERPGRVRLLPKDCAQFRIAPFSRPGGWGIEFCVPAAFVALFVPGFTFSGQAAANFYKCGDCTQVPHYLAWAPLSSPSPDFHRRQDFGRLVFQ